MGGESMGGQSHLTPIYLLYSVRWITLDGQVRTLMGNHNKSDSSNKPQHAK
jgi:hypothetical protein